MPVDFGNTQRIVFLSLCIIYLLNPVFGIVLLSMVVAVSKQRMPQSAFTLLAVFLSLWLGVLNMTKIPESDMANYVLSFNSVPFKGLVDTLLKQNSGVNAYEMREPLYAIITWAGYYLCFGKAPLFIAALTFVMYYLLMKATQKLFATINAQPVAVLCGMLTLAFFTQYFVLSAHLIRQFLAASMVVYAIVGRVVDGNKRWPWHIGAVLIHTSVLLLVLLSLIPFIYKRMNRKSVLLVLSAFVPFIVLNQVIGTTLSQAIGISPLQYAAQRFSSNVGDGNEVPYVMMLMVCVPILIAVTKLLRELREDDNHKLYPIIYIYLLLVLFVLSFSQNPLIQYRFFYMTYSFIPLLLPLMFYLRNKLLCKIYCVGVSLFFFVRFFVIHNTSGFTYAPVEELLFMPLPGFFANGFLY